MYQLNNFFDNKNMKVLEQKGCFTILEHEKDLSVSPESAIVAYYASEMKLMAGLETDTICLFSQCGLC